MTKNIKTRSINGIDKFDISTQTGHTNTNVTFIKTVISISANYTKDAILQSTICEHTNSTTDEDISFLNNFDKFPSLRDHKLNHKLPAQIETDEIIYAFENSIEPFVEFKSDQDVSWIISGGFDSNKFILSENKLAFINAVNYEKPENFLKNNIYNIIIKATNKDNISTSKNFSIVVRNEIEVNEKIDNKNNFLIDVENIINMPNNIAFVSYLNITETKKNILWEIDKSNDYQLFEIVILNTNIYAIQFKKIIDDNFIRNFKIIIKATDDYNNVELKTVNITTIPVEKYSLNTNNKVISKIDEVIYKIKNNDLCFENNQTSGGSGGNNTNTLSIYNKYFKEIDLQILYEQLVKMFLTKGPLYLPQPAVINKLYFNIRKALENDENKSVHLLLFKDIIDVIFKTKNIFIHNISVEKQIKDLKKKNKEAICKINDLKQQIRNCASDDGAGYFGIEGKVTMKTAKFKPGIYYQAKFNIVLAWYIYLHDSSNVVPSLYYMTVQYLKQFKSKEESYNKLIELLDDQYNDLENDLEENKSSSSNPETSSNSEQTQDSSSSEKFEESSSSKESETNIDSSTISSSDESHDETDTCQHTETSTSTSSSTSSSSSSSSSSSTSSSSEDSCLSSEETNSDLDDEPQDINDMRFCYKNPHTNNFVYFFSGHITLKGSKKYQKRKKRTINRKNKIKYKKVKTKKISYLSKFHYKPLPGRIYTYNSNGNTIYFLKGAFNLKANNFSKLFCRKRKKTQKHYHFCPFNKTSKKYISSK